MGAEDRGAVPTGSECRIGEAIEARIKCFGGSRRGHEPHNTSAPQHLNTSTPQHLNTSTPQHLDASGASLARLHIP
jgi:hypothetical protein